jgi:hypothetical protein
MEDGDGTRVRKQGNQRDRTTGNLIAAAFTHTSSRALDRDRIQALVVVSPPPHLVRKHGRGKAMSVICPRTWPPPVHDYTDPLSAVEVIAAERSQRRRHVPTISTTSPMVQSHDV